MFQSSLAFVRCCGLTLMMAIATSAAVWACPNCKDALAHDPAQAGLVRGFFWSIMFMVSMPFLVFGGVSAYFYWEVRRAKQAKLAALARESSSIRGGSPFAEAESMVQAEPTLVEEAVSIGVS